MSSAAVTKRDATEPRVLALRNCFRDEQREEMRIGPLFAFGAHEQIAPHPTGVREM